MIDVWNQMKEGHFWSQVNRGNISPREAAHAYLNLGYSAIPVQAGTKRVHIGCCYPECFGRLPTASAIDAWWQRYPDAQVGIALGVNDLRVLDFEQTQEYMRFDHLIRRLIGLEIEGSLAVQKALWDMPKVATPSGGFHLYFRCAGLGSGLASRYYEDLAILKGKSAINLLISHRYVVAPPTQLDGTYYLWSAMGPNPDTIPEITVELAHLLFKFCYLVGDGTYCADDYDVNYDDWRDEE